MVNTKEKMLIRQKRLSVRTSVFVITANGSASKAKTITVPWMPMYNTAITLITIPIQNTNGFVCCSLQQQKSIAGGIKNMYGIDGGLTVRAKYMAMGTASRAGRLIMPMPVTM